MSRNSAVVLAMVSMILAAAVIAATAQQETITVTVNADPLECVTRVAVFSETRRVPVKTSFDGSRWVSEPIPINEAITVSFELDEGCRDAVIVNDVTLERVYGTRISQVLTYDASYTIKARRQPLSYVTIRAEPPECLVSISSSKPVKKEGGLYIIGPVKAGEAVSIRPSINRQCSFKEYVGDPYAAASARPDITLQPSSNTTLTLVLTMPQPPSQTEQRTETVEAPALPMLLQSLQQYLPLVIGMVAVIGGAYAAYRAASKAREKRRREEEFSRRFAAAKSAFIQQGRSLTVRKGWLWLEVDPVREILNGTDTDRIATAYLMLASVIPVSRDLRRRLYEETVNEYNAATGATLSGYAPQATMYSAEQNLIRLSVQLALEDADTVEEVRKEIRRRGGDPWIIPRRLIGLDAVVYEARGTSIYDLGFRLEGEEKIREEADVVRRINCPKCGATAFESFKHCVSCGAMLRPKEEPAPPAEKRVEKMEEPEPAKKEAIKEKRPTITGQQPPAKPQAIKPMKGRERPPTPAVKAEETPTEIEKPALLTVVEKRAKTSWELPKWILEELEGLGVRPEEVVKAVESTPVLDDVDKAAYRAASTIAKKVELATDNERAALITQLAASILPYAINEYRAALSQKQEAEEQVVGEGLKPPVEDRGPGRVEAPQSLEQEVEDVQREPPQRVRGEGGVDVATGRGGVETPAQPPQPQQKAGEQETEAESITLIGLTETWRRPGTAYLLDDSVILAAGLPTGVVSRLFRGRGRVIDMEKMKTPPEALVRYLEGGPALLILTRGRYPRRRIKTVEPEEGYKPLRLLRDVVSRVDPKKLCLLTHPAIFDTLPQEVRRGFKVVRVTLDVAKAREVLAERFADEAADKLAVAQALIPLAEMLASGEEELAKFLKDFMAEDDAEYVTAIAAHAAFGHGELADIPKALLLSLGIVDEP